MEIKLFGKSLFSFNKNGALMEVAYNHVKESKFLPDFYQMNGGGNSDFISSAFIQELSSTGPVVKTPEPKKDDKEKITPKGVYNLKMLNDKEFKLKTDPDYVDEQLASFREKLSLVKGEEYDMRRGTEELASIVARLENRKKYAENKAFFEEYPYTTTSKITDLIKEHDHLKIGQIAQFMADLPKEAVDVMKAYNKTTDKLCGKQAVFYIIAEKKDFEKTVKRRDPILLAQSPFGHFWQICGAWDKEMLLIEEL